MFIFKIILGIILSILASFYFYFFFKKLLTTFSVKFSKNIQAICLIFTIFLGCGCLNYVSFSAIMVYHFVMFSLFVYALFKIIKLIFKHKNTQILNKIICTGIIPLLLTVGVLSYGYVNINTVYEKSYTVESEKLTNNYKFLLLSDLHFGTVQKTSVLKNSIEKFNQLKLDFVVLDGDIIDEFSTKQDMVLVFETFSKINTNYGIYYVFGNHDRQQKTKHHYFSESDIINELNKNDIIILSDSKVKINNDIVLIGREDEEFNSKNRKEISTMIETQDDSNFILVADHQPIELNKNAKAGVDLQISGHTHAFQVWPLGELLNSIGFYTYGKYKVDNTTLIVTSGFAGWGFPNRTEKHCEYVVVNLTKK